MIRTPPPPKKKKKNAKNLLIYIHLTREEGIQKKLI